ncbi:acyl-CoA dehydrogenase [Mycolicibacterium chitae]|uniref:Phosphotransferase enzyme family protein n=1 Tax=Mycolicibacterium chitae TaxID=1792 RepID=A0A3S4RM19_MYCCI|nr:phosphotransferase family protein [Mycolicibacterium chitae]MCV7106284.1 phosphotransferase family protein [Mycolicibacterium chitae]BBZ03801.1 acyl-CoA dehydrogenase [Mycolicibacterium chitae]VEG47455.1 phosphotransferase enzyme family protein [Mycolicibacterium chitae]
MSALDLVALQGFLQLSGVKVDGELTAELISGGRSNLTYAVRDSATHWVLRRPPTAGLTPSAHDVAREYRVADGLQGTGVPVAETVVLCEDESVLGAPFSLVRHVDGVVIRSQEQLDAHPSGAIEACLDSLVDVIVDLHAVDYQACGLGDFGRPDGFLERQIKLWARQWRHMELAAGDDIRALHGWLTDNTPAQRYSSIVHGDYRIDNVIVDAENIGRIAAVVDWELSTLGDPLTDVALMCAYRNPAMDLVLGFPAAWTSPRLADGEQIAQRYAERSGRDLSDWNFYLALAYFKLAVIAAGIDYRYRAGAGEGAGFDTAGHSVAPFIAAGLSATQGVTV